jgi:hypothetical protein
MPIPDRFLFHQANGAVLFFYDWETLLSRISYFAHKGPDFLVLELEDGRYVQCAGVKKRLTVETRVYSEGRHFTHRVWGKGAMAGVKQSIQCTDGGIEVDGSQVLTMRDARILMLAFLEGNPMPDRYVATDISSRFGPLPDDMMVRNKAWNWPDRRLLKRNAP